MEFVGHILFLEHLHCLSRCYRQLRQCLGTSCGCGCVGRGRSLYPWVQFAGLYITASESQYICRLKTLILTTHSIIVSTCGCRYSLCHLAGSLETKPRWDTGSETLAQRHDAQYECPLCTLWSSLIGGVENTVGALSLSPTYWCFVLAIFLDHSLSMECSRAWAAVPLLLLWHHTTRLYNDNCPSPLGVCLVAFLLHILCVWWNFGSLGKERLYTWTVCGTCQCLRHEISGLERYEIRPS